PAARADPRSDDRVPCAWPPSARSPRVQREQSCDSTRGRRGGAGARVPCDGGADRARGAPPRHFAHALHAPAVPELLESHAAVSARAERAKMNQPASRESIVLSRRKKIVFAIVTFVLVCVF